MLGMGFSSLEGPLLSSASAFSPSTEGGGAVGICSSMVASPLPKMGAPTGILPPGRFNMARLPFGLGVEVGVVAMAVVNLS